jgi:hypothetical protein
MTTLSIETSTTQKLNFVYLFESENYSIIYGKRVNVTEEDVKNGFVTIDLDKESDPGNSLNIKVDLKTLKVCSGCNESLMYFASFEISVFKLLNENVKNFHIFKV